MMLKPRCIFKIHVCGFVLHGCIDICDVLELISIIVFPFHCSIAPTVSISEHAYIITLFSVCLDMDFVYHNSVYLYVYCFVICVITIVKIVKLHVFRRIRLCIKELLNSMKLHNEFKSYVNVHMQYTDCNIYISFF